MDVRPLVFWEVDTQADFMLPGGKLYVPAAEKIIPNVQRLVQSAVRHHFPLISSADAHAVDDPEFKLFPSHCVAGTLGAEIIPEGLAPESVCIPSDEKFRFSAEVLKCPQIILEKQHLDVFTNPHAKELVGVLPFDAEYIVFGVVTELCVKCAASGLLELGRAVYVVTDAIETLKAEEGRRTLDVLESQGARRITTEEVLLRIGSHAECL